MFVVVCLYCSIQVILFCVAIGKDPQHIRFGVIDMDATGPLFASQASALALPDYGSGQALIMASEVGVSQQQQLQPGWRGYLPDSIAASYEFLQPEPKPIPANFLSAQLISNLNDHFIMRTYPDVSSAQAAVRTNAVWGYILIPTNFTRNSLDRINQTVLHPGGALSNDTLANSTLTYTLDMSNEQMTIYLVKSIYTAYTQLIGQFVPDAVRFNPLQQSEPVYGDADASFTDFVAPGIIITSVGAIRHTQPVSWCARKDNACFCDPFSHCCAAATCV